VSSRCKKYAHSLRGADIFARYNARSGTMTEPVTEVFRSPYRADCHERAFMLSAVGISSAIEFDREGYRLSVDAESAAAALEHLHAYESERRMLRPRRSAPRPALPHAWVGCALYVIVLIAVALAVANGWWRLDAFDVGELDAAQVQRGQWWRAWTALTLHLDGPHLLANLGAGVWFGYLAAAEIGSGTAWLLAVTGAALANITEGLLGPAEHRSVGASTAVFTALGLLVAHSWGLRLHLTQSWALRWAPLVAGAVLLGWFGSAGEGTDVVAHVLGFLMGCLLGAAAALPLVAKALARVPQWFAGVLTLLSLAIAWGCALTR
jgi:membrane associated rhomboid family serine protease